MAISPPSDIILGVANAADPRKYRAAVEKLARASGQAGGPAVELAEPAAGLSAGGAATAPLPAKNTRLASHGPDTRPGVFSHAIRPATDPGEPETYKPFETFLVQTFVEAMLPKDAESVFGKGPAGMIWKSVLAEQLAKEVMQGTGFGIAEAIAERRKILDAAHAAPGEGARDATQGADGLKADHLSQLRKMLAAQGELAVFDAGLAASGVETRDGSPI